MAHYTITVKTMLDNNLDITGKYLNDYPIWSEDYRSTLNEKILNHYYESEIGLETTALWGKYLRSKMFEIMPYYNELYKIQARMIEERLENNVNLTEEFYRKVSNSGKGTSSGTETGASTDKYNDTSSSNSKEVYLDTPQGSTYKGNIDDTNYATNVTWNKVDGTGSRDRNGTSTNTSSVDTTTENSGNENYTKTIIGNNGKRYNIDILKDIKNNLINIDMNIIDELQELFMGIY